MNSKTQHPKLIRTPRPFVHPIPNCLVLRDYCSEHLDERIQVEATVGERRIYTACQRHTREAIEVDVTTIRMVDVVLITGIPIAKFLFVNQGMRTAHLTEGQRVRFCATCGEYRCGYEPDETCSGLGYIGPVVILDAAPEGGVPSTR
ncbi:MAG: hypothetical protein J0M02_01340 [Planctomycetes bacterium]|nr:hypothetical protein [Planctomycetota bacterium]